MVVIDDDPIIQAIAKERSYCAETLHDLKAKRQELTNLLELVERQIETTLLSFCAVTKALDRTRASVKERYASFQDRYYIDDNALISSLPTNVLEHIFSFLSPHTVCTCVVVTCKKWHIIVLECQGLWKAWCGYEMLFGKVDPVALLQLKNYNVLKSSQINYQGLLEDLYKTERQWRKMTPKKSTILPSVFMGSNMQDDDGETFVNIRINRRNNTVCSATRTGAVCEWDMDTYECLYAHKTDGDFDEVEFCGRNFVSTEYSTLSVWNMNTGKCVDTSQSLTPFSALCVTTDTDTIFTANGEVIHSWSMASSSLQKTHQYKHMCFAPVQHFAYRDSILVSVASNTIMVWDVRMKERLRVLDEKSHYVVFNGKTIVALEGYGTVLKIIELFHDPSPLKIKLPSLCSFSWGMCLEGNKLVLPFGACVDVLDIRNMGDVFPSLDFSYFVNYVDTYVGRMFCGLENGTIQSMEF